MRCSGRAAPQLRCAMGGSPRPAASPVAAREVPDPLRRERPSCQAPPPEFASRRWKGRCRGSRRAARGPRRSSYPTLIRLDPQSGCPIRFGDGNQHNSKYQIMDTIPGAITVNNADGIQFHGNVVKHIGNRERGHLAHQRRRQLERRRQRGPRHRRERHHGGAPAARLPGRRRRARSTPRASRASAPTTPSPATSSTTPAPRLDVLSARRLIAASTSSIQARTLAASAGNARERSSRRFSRPARSSKSNPGSGVARTSPGAGSTGAHRRPRRGRRCSSHPPSRPPCRRSARPRPS